MVATKLPCTFDPVRLEADLAVCDDFAWEEHNADGWLCLALRSCSGKVTDATQGPLGWDRWLDTPLMARCPYFHEVVRTLELTYRLASIRVSSLMPGGRVQPHMDDTTPRRVHVPVVTNPDAVLVIGGVEHRWQAGEAWLGEFGLVHAAWNHGTTRRVHLLALVR